MSSSINWYSEQIGEKFFFWLELGNSKDPPFEELNRATFQVLHRVMGHEDIHMTPAVEGPLGVFYEVFECDNYYAATLMFACMSPENCNWQGKWSNRDK